MPSHGLAQRVNNYVAEKGTRAPTELVVQDTVSQASNMPQVLAKAGAHRSGEQVFVVKQQTKLEQIADAVDQIDLSQPEVQKILTELQEASPEIVDMAKQVNERLSEDASTKDSLKTSMKVLKDTMSKDEAKELAKKPVVMKAGFDISEMVSRLKHNVSKDPGAAAQCMVNLSILFQLRILISLAAKNARLNERLVELEEGENSVTIDDKTKNT